MVSVRRSLNFNAQSEHQNVPIQYITSSFPTPIRYLSCTYLIPVRYLSGTGTILMWYLSSTYLEPIGYLSCTYQIRQKYLLISQTCKQYSLFWLHLAEQMFARAHCSVVRLHTNHGTNLSYNIVYTKFQSNNNFMAYTLCEMRRY